MSADVRGRSADIVAANVPPTPPLNFLVDDVDARAHEANRIATEIEQIVQADGHWPRGGWNHAVLVEQIAQRLRLGQRGALIVGAVRTASARAPNAHPISAFQYFDDAITAAHAAADRIPQLPQLPLRGGRNGLKAVESSGRSMEEIARELGKAYVRLDTPQWEAWRMHRGGKPLQTDRTGGWLVESEWPPGWQAQKKAEG